MGKLARTCKSQGVCKQADKWLLPGGGAVSGEQDMAQALWCRVAAARKGSCGMCALGLEMAAAELGRMMGEA